MPRNFPPKLSLFPPPSNSSDSTVYMYFCITFPPQWHQVLNLFVLETVILYEPLLDISTKKTHSAPNANNYLNGRGIPIFRLKAHNSCRSMEHRLTFLIYRIAGKFGGELNLVVWQSTCTFATAKLIHTCIHTYGDPLPNRQI